MKSLIFLFLLSFSFCGFSQKTYQARHLKNTQCQLGEGAFWDGELSRFWFVDIEKGRVHFLDWQTKNLQSHYAGQKVGTVIPEKGADRFIMGLEDGIYFSQNLESKPTLLNKIKGLEKPARLNDGKCDPSGCLYVGGLHHEKKRSSQLFCRNEKGEVKSILDSVSISNGICWSQDGKVMYYIDTPTRCVKAFDFEVKTGKISNPRIVVSSPDSLGWPDGMSIDQTGNLWIGMWGGSCVSAWSPETGKLVALVKVPAKNVTSCAFGGEMKNRLLITTAREGLSPEELLKFPLSGDLFEAEVGVSGPQMPYWNGK
jgi:sugar lactone lactonase YvrE